MKVLVKSGGQAGDCYFFHIQWEDCRKGKQIYRTLRFYKNAIKIPKSSLWHRTIISTLKNTAKGGKMQYNVTKPIASCFIVSVLD